VIPEEKLRNPKAIDPRSLVMIEGDSATLKLGPEMERTVKLKVDPAKKPKQIDFINNDGRVEVGIYMIQVDLLSICLAGKGEERPRQFLTDAKNNTWLVVLKKD
jgi:uncharacterized protein (TIGR03067 family)